MANGNYNAGKHFPLFKRFGLVACSLLCDAFILHSLHVAAVCLRLLLTDRAVRMRTVSSSEWCKMTNPHDDCVDSSGSYVVDAVCDAALLWICSLQRSWRHVWGLFLLYYFSCQTSNVHVSSPSGTMRIQSNYKPKRRCEDQDDIEHVYTVAHVSSTSAAKALFDYSSIQVYFVYCVRKCVCVGSWPVGGLCQVWFHSPSSHGSVRSL